MKTIVVLLTAFVVLPRLTQSQEPPKPTRLLIEITADGFSPATVTAPPKAPIELVFLRLTDNTCAKEVVIPELKIKKPLPLKEPVSIVFTPEKSEIGFACGMNMLKGKVVVK